MPEGDTVFLAGKRLHDALAGKELMRGELRHPRWIEHDLTGRTVLEVATVGKHLFTRFDDGTSLHSHFRMDGTWHLYRPGRPWRGADHQIRAILGVADRVAVGFRLHDLDLLPTDREDTWVGHLGPDLLAEDWGPDHAVEIERLLRTHPDREIGAALLDQRVACGVGNVYKSEVLFVCGVDPFTKVAALDTDTRRRLITTASRLLRANLGTNQRTTVPGGLAVYGRNRQACRRCGTTVRTRRQGEHARSTYWCPTCQPARVAR
jgi:endonuclease-8